MRSLLTTLLLALTACGGAAQNGTLYARIVSDQALASPFTTQDGWSLTFSHVVVGISSFSVTGSGTNAFPAAMTGSKLLDFSKDTHTDLASNTSANPTTYDHVSIVLGRGGTETNVNVPTDVLARMGTRSVWIEGSATKQSTTRAFQLGSSATLTFDPCMPVVELVPFGTATVEFQVHAQRMFFDDAGALRFEPFGLADTSPQDGTVVIAEAATVMTSTLPPAQYGATMGTLVNVLEKRALTLVGLGDSGTCSGR